MTTEDADKGRDGELAVAAVVLAAGAGSRLGGRPKALLELDGVPLIRRQLAALMAAGIDDVVVVLGHYAQAVEAALAGSAARPVRNPQPDDGQALSLRLGLQALPSRLDAVLVALADQPLIEARDVRALLEAFGRRGGRSMVVPRVLAADGQRTPGNPVMLDAALARQWLHGPVEATGRRWREQHPERVFWFDTDNRHYSVDIDTSEDLARFAAETGRTLAWPGAAGGKSSEG